MAEITGHLSLTEVPHFGLLVQFVYDVEEYAYDEDDHELLGKIDELRAALAELGRA